MLGFQGINKSLGVFDEHLALGIGQPSPVLRSVARSGRKQTLIEPRKAVRSQDRDSCAVLHNMNALVNTMTTPGCLTLDTLFFGNFNDGKKLCAHHLFGTVTMI